MTPEEMIKMVDQNTLQKVYDDGLSNPTKETGKILADLIKALRLFTAPIQLLASYQGRLEKYLNEVRDSVPKEKQIECPASISGPVLEKLKYIEDENYLKNLYLNLLKRAIDKDRVNEAHPAFVTLIEQLSPDEALILKTIRDEKIRFDVKYFSIIEVGDTSKPQIIKNEFPLDKLAFPENFKMYLDHLVFLNLVETRMYNKVIADDHEQKPVVESKLINLTNFGNLFGKACLPS